MKEYVYHIFAPYRVCPLGAHVDHRHGLVSGFAIDIRSGFVVQLRRFNSANGSKKLNH